MGDEVTITTEYNDMIAINTMAKEAEASGIIKEILIAPQVKLKLLTKTEPLNSIR